MLVFRFQVEQSAEMLFKCLHEIENRLKTTSVRFTRCLHDIVICIAQVVPPAADATRMHEIARG